MTTKLCKCHPTARDAYRLDCQRANERAEQMDRFERTIRDQEYTNARREPGDE